MDRRQFLKCSALLGGSLAAGSLGISFFDAMASPSQAGLPDAGVYQQYLPENQLYTVCQQCNANCGIKVKLLEGRVAKIDGNPYSPWTLSPHLPFDTPRSQTATVEGAICPKGQAGIQTLYDPYRLVKVLKRAGKRGENKWKTISYDQAVNEIANGGNLFGEGKVEGLKEICPLTDPAIAETLAKDANKVAAKEMTIDDFKTKHADNLKYLIDPNHPDLGPKNNQFCLYWGRMKGGRNEFLRRFGQALGTINAHGHTTVCQGSLYFTCKAISDQFVEGKWTDGSKFYWQGDIGNSEFVIFVGANPFDANYGPPYRSPKITNGLSKGRLKMAVIDPRCTKVASKAWKWLPVAPNGVTAVAMGMIHWIIENNRFDARYLSNANKAAAKLDNEPTWTQSAWLVKLDKEGKPGPFLRGSDLGLPPVPRKGKDDKEWLFDPFMVFKAGQCLPFDPNSETEPVKGEPLVSTEVNGLKVKTVLQVYREVAAARTLAQWADIAGIKEVDLAELAWEFTSHGKKAVADIHRGVSQHTSGFYNVLAWMLVNILIGNHDWMGGLCKATTYNMVGDKKGQPFNTANINGAIKGFGIDIIRGGKVYDKSTLFTGFPAKRVWYPFSSDVYQEVIPSLGDAYPYPIKALLLYMGTPVYSLPAGHELISILSDPKKLPLFIVSDIVVGETSMYADYIFPDLTYLERWEFAGSHPSFPFKVGPFRQPVCAPLTETVTPFGQSMPVSLEALFLGLAEKLKLPGFGENAFGQGQHLKRDEDMYIRMVANIAFGEKEDGSDKVAAAGPEEIAIFEKSHRHLPATVYDLKRWKDLVGAEIWPHVVYLLNRGGRFQNFQKAYANGQMTNKYGKMLGIYLEKQLKTKNSMTGQPYLHYADFVPGPTDCQGRLLNDAAQGFDLTLLTYKTISQTKSRTGGNYWLQAVYPENYLDVSAHDARRLNLSDGDMVKVISPSNPTGTWELGPTGSKPMIGRVRVLEGLRPGCVAFSLGHGHWANGARPIEVDGVIIPGDERRATGIHANAAMRVDPVLKNTGLVDVTGGSAVFYQSQVKLVKV
ncbi:MAG: molybdopterin-dependent oxidoreductase [Deltaproteobacteria bacterium]|nr:molybdopterin-dependent oxidoreductase [Deltaproteobacteria bacterium]